MGFWLPAPTRERTHPMLAELDGLRGRLEAVLADPAAGADLAPLVEWLKALWAAEETRDLGHAAEAPGAAALLHRNYFEAVGLVYQAALEGRDISEELLRELHGALYRGVGRIATVRDGQVSEQPLTPGDYRTVAVEGIYRGRRVQFEDAARIEEHMTELVARHARSAPDLHPVVAAAWFGAHVARIHPFLDGNGRTGRLAMSLVLIRADYPPFILRAAEGDGYLAALRAADAGDLVPFVAVVQTNLARTMRDILGHLSGSASPRPA